MREKKKGGVRFHISRASRRANTLIIFFLEKATAWRAAGALGKKGWRSGRHPSLYEKEEKKKAWPALP